MDDKQAMHAMSIDDAYHVERTLARGPSGVTELVSIDGNGPFVRKKIPSPLAQRNVWAALSACQSNRLPRVEATYELPDRFVIVYDYVPGSTLAQIAEEKGLRTFSWRLSERFLVCSVLRSVRGRWSYTSQRR